MLQKYLNWKSKICLTNNSAILAKCKRQIFDQSFMAILTILDKMWLETTLKSNFLLLNNLKYKENRTQ